MITKKIVVLAAIISIITGCTIMKPIKKQTHLATNYTILQKQVSHYLEEQPGAYGLYFIDLISHHQFGYNSSAPFHAASTFKVPMNLYLYNQLAPKNNNISNNKITLDKKLTYAPKHLEGGTGVLLQKQVGGSYTVRELARYSIVDSDNIATNILLDNLGKQNVKNFMRSLGAWVVDNDKNITCPRDLALYLSAVLSLDRSPTPGASLLLQDMFNARDKERLPKPLPTTIKIANKVGTWPPSDSYHDMAYIVHPQRPYILVVCSQETRGYPQALKVMHHISKMVYDFQNEL